jgi:predicted amidohydrolase
MPRRIPESAKLLFGPYTPPPLRKGDRATCLYYDAEVVITSWSSSRISWPRCRTIGHRGGSGLLVDEELARAVRHESAAALMYWWGVSENTATLWRKAFGVEGWTATEGTYLLVRAAAELLRKLARAHIGVVGGSFLAKSGTDCFNSFLLVFPDGQYHRHDKDLPTMWENSYYLGGSDDGVLATPAGPVGAALCWELIRSQTARRLVGKVNVVVGGSCWWDMRNPVSPQYADDQARLRNFLRQAPGDLARRLGVPVVHAAQAGEFEGLTPGNETVLYVSRFLGETQITDGHGHVLARLAYEDGEGVVTADIAPGRVEGDLAPTPEGFGLSNCRQS